MSKSFIDEIGEFLTDLILGDFSKDQGKAAMVVGGAISLIPVVDQVMDVRDVSGMIYRISKVGPAKATKDDWMDAALAAFGCIPEVGSLFKTIVKPLRTMRKEAGALGAGGNVMIEAMLAKSKGAAIKFMKTFDWAQNTQLALISAMAALDSCIALLDELSREHWWLSAELQYTARDLKPQVEALRNPLKSGIAQGSQALQEMIRDLLGEDALMVAQNVAYAASVARNSAARHNDSSKIPTRSRDTKNALTLKKTSEQTSQGRGIEHKPQANSSRQFAREGNSTIQNATRKIESAISEIDFVGKGLIGEHLADYYHMAHHLKVPELWPHGDYKASWRQEFPRIFSKNSSRRRPKELIPQDLGAVTTSGIDTIWMVSKEEYHFVEAKLSASGGAVYGLGLKRMKAAKGSRIPMAPANLSPRQLALWCLLSEPRNGTQMSKKWVRQHLTNTTARNAENLQNRWVYLFLILPTARSPFGTLYKLGEQPLRLDPAPGIQEHIVAAAELLATGKYKNVRDHDGHIATHGVSEIFQADEIDFVDRRRASISSKPDSPTNSNSDGSNKKPNRNIMDRKRPRL